MDIKQKIAELEELIAKMHGDDIYTHITILAWIRKFSKELRGLKSRGQKVDFPRDLFADSSESMRELVVKGLMHAVQAFAIYKLKEEVMAVSGDRATWPCER